VAVDLVHRFAAGLALLLAAGLLVAYRRAVPDRRDLEVGAWLLVATMVAQAAAGAFLVLSGFGLTAELLHSALTGITFTAVSYLCLLVTLGTRPATEAAAEPPAGSPSARLRSEGAP